MQGKESKAGTSTYRDVGDLDCGRGVLRDGLSRLERDRPAQSGERGVSRSVVERRTKRRKTRGTARRRGRKGRRGSPETKNKRGRHGERGKVADGWVGGGRGGEDSPPELFFPSRLNILDHLGVATDPLKPSSKHSSTLLA